MEGDFSTARISGNFEAGAARMPLELQSSTTDDNMFESLEGYILCIIIHEDQLDPRDRGRIQIPLVRRDILIKIIDNDPPRKSSMHVYFLFLLPWFP